MDTAKPATTKTTPATTAAMPAANQSAPAATEPASAETKPAATENIESDLALARRSQQGDSDAFAALVRKYQDRVYNTCYRMCHNHADAADLTQSAFMKAFKAIGRFEAKSGFYTWLFRIATNAVLSERRSRSRQRVVSLSSLGGDGRSGTDGRGGPDGRASGDGLVSADGRAGPHGLARGADASRSPPAFASRLEQNEFSDRISAALQELDEEFKIVVVLKDIEEMDYATISEVLDLPLGTVKSRLHRGRLILRELLREVVD